MKKHILAFVAGLVFSQLASASLVTFTTPEGARVSDGLVHASATFSIAAGTLTINLQDLLADPTSVGQLIGNLQFTLHPSVTGTTMLTSSSGEEVSVGSGGRVSNVSTLTPGWGFGTFGSGFILCVICPNQTLTPPPSAQPAQLILGPGPYTKANGSIAGNPAHNPFLTGPVTFTITNSNVTSNTTVSDVLFSFGTQFATTSATTSATSVAGVVELAEEPLPTPEPSSFLLMAGGLLLVPLSRLANRRRQRAK